MVGAWSTNSKVNDWYWGSYEGFPVEIRFNLLVVLVVNVWHSVVYKVIYVYKTWFLYMTFLVTSPANK